MVTKPKRTRQPSLCEECLQAGYGVMVHTAGRWLCQMCDPRPRPPLPEAPMPRRWAEAKPLPPSAVSAPRAPLSGLEYRVILKAGPVVMHERIMLGREAIQAATSWRQRGADYYAEVVPLRGLPCPPAGVLSQGLIDRARALGYRLRLLGAREKRRAECLFYAIAETTAARPRVFVSGRDYLTHSEAETLRSMPL